MHEGGFVEEMEELAAMKGHGVDEINCMVEIRQQGLFCRHCRSRPVPLQVVREAIKEKTIRGNRHAVNMLMSDVEDSSAK